RFHARTRHQSQAMRRSTPRKVPHEYSRAGLKTRPPRRIPGDASASPPARRQRKLGEVRVRRLPRELAMIDLEQFWADDSFEYPSVTEQEIQAWEREHGVALPQLLREVLRRQNGGTLRYAPVSVNRLRDIAPVDESFWEWVAFDEDEFEGRRGFRFASEDEAGGDYLLNYAAHGPRGEPSVYLSYSGDSDLANVADSVDEFIANQFKIDEAPQVNWDETSDLAVIERESVELSGPFGTAGRLEQVLGRDGNALVYFTRMTSPTDEALTKSSLPEPLTTNMAMGSATIRRMEPGPNAPWALHIQPEDLDGIVEVRSEKTADDMWRNRVSQGAPIYVQFLSPDRARLEDLRRTLFGAAAAAAAQEHDEVQERLQEKRGDGTDPAEGAAMMQVFLQSMQRMGVPPEQEVADVPPELAGAAAAIRGKLLEAMKKAQEVVAQSPPDPETLKLMQKLMGNL